MTQGQSQAEVLQDAQDAHTPLGERSPTREEQPVETWVCENPRCEYAGKKRTVRYAHLGQGLYMRGPIICHCGRQPVREPKVGAKR